MNNIIDINDTMEMLLIGGSLVVIMIVMLVKFQDSIRMITSCKVSLKVFNHNDKR